MTNALVAALALLMAALPAVAQEKITVSRTPDGYLTRVEDRFGVRPQLLPSVPRMLDDFVVGVVRPADSRNFLTSVSASRDLFPVATVDSVADGLERLALTHPDDQVAVAALYSLGLLGDARAPIRRGSVERLVRIYHRTNLRRRSAVVGVLCRAGERSEAAAFLRSVAVRTDLDERLPHGAVFSLSLLGPEGVATLRELHQRKLVTSSYASMLLGGLAHQGYDSRAAP